MTLGVALILAVLLYQFVQMIFLSPLRKYDQEWKEKALLRDEYHRLLERKKDLESEWRSKEPYLASSARPEEALNSWVKKILKYAQAQGLIFEKVEPQGMKEKEGRKEIRLSLFFHTDIRKFTELVFYLRESEPFTQVETLSVKPEEDSKSLACELTLKKVLP